MSIVDFISSWLRDIVVLFILISISELLMPKGNMKKYIDLIIGFLIIFTIITPFAKIIKKDFSFDETVFNYSNSSSFIERDEEEFQIEQDKQIERLYKEKIKNEIIKLVGEESLYTVNDVLVVLEEEEEIYGEIQGLKIILNGEEEDVKEKKISIEKVESVDLSKELPSKVEENQTDYMELKKILSAKYDINKDKISIIKYE